MSLYFESKPDSWIICCMHALLRRPKSHISIPGHESSFDEVMFPKIDSFDLNFPARRYLNKKIKLSNCSYSLLLIKSDTCLLDQLL